MVVVRYLWRAALPPSNLPPIRCPSPALPPHGRGAFSASNRRVRPSVASSTRSRCRSQNIKYKTNARGSRPASPPPIHCRLAASLRIVEIVFLSVHLPLDTRAAFRNMRSTSLKLTRLPWRVHLHLGSGKAFRMPSFSLISLLLSSS